MAPELGIFALILAFILSLSQAFFGLTGAWRGKPVWMAVARPAVTGQFVFVVMAFACLVYSFVNDDFSVLYVAHNSNSHLPLFYRVAAVWGAHEGSLLLWILILSIWSVAVAAFSRLLPLTFSSRVLGVMGLISSGFMLFTLWTSSPFLRLIPAAPDGADLNPVLQDFALAIHPPMLYTGYVGFSVAFAFACAAMLEGRLDQTWAKWTRPWTIFAWIFQTIGIALGSWWAYYELGWGGWWFWDPVENASFMPWLAGTALLHSAVVMEKREALKIWTILLAILTFSLSLIGTFLVRSGVLTSVHAFASDPMRGIFILVILVTFIGGGLALFAWRAPLLRQGGLFAPVSREGALVLNNLLLTTALATVLFGTLYPLALEQFTGERISVGAPFFNMTAGLLLLALTFLTPFGFSLAWKRGDLLGVAQRLAVAFAGGLVVFVGVLAVYRGGPVLAPVAAALAIYVMLGTFTEVFARIRRGGASLSVALSRARGMPLSFWGGATAHFGVGMLLLGLAATGFGTETIASMRVGAPLTVGPYEVTLDNVGQRGGPN